MITLRILKRKVKPPEPTEGEIAQSWGGDFYEEILQYRHVQFPIILDASGDLSSECKWTDWVDVPTIVEVEEDE